MKKLFLMLALFSACAFASAQIATENSNVFDNVGVGVTAGVSTPLDFNSVFPLNTNVGIKITKDVTPVIGFQLEGIALLNDNHFSDLGTAFKATNLGLNGVLNLSNAFLGYNGTPKFFEVSAVGGIGWFHKTNKTNFLTAKTGIDLSFNLGKEKAHSLVITPALYWNLNKFRAIHFDKRGSQLAINLSYIYHFKNSNGTHHFKTYDIGSMNNEIAYLQGALDECRNKAPEKVEVKKFIPTQVLVEKQWFVQFAQNSYELTDEAKSVLNSIGNDLIVDVVGTASPEGEEETNKVLSEKRALTVADYLDKRGVKVRSSVGKGVQIGLSTNRLAIITVAD